MKNPEILLINDIHVSKDNIQEFYANWNEALDICKKHGIKDIVVGGDLWQSRSAQTLSTLLAVRQMIQKTIRQDIRLTIAEGNHDLVDQESFDGYSHLFADYDNVDVVDDYISWEIGCGVMFYVMSYFPENGSFTNRLNWLIDNDLDTTKTNILYIHEGINGAIATASDNELPTHIFQPFDKVLVGHYHNRCVIKDTNIEYIGASRQHGFGEDEEKGYTILYSDGSYEFVKNQVNIRYKTIDVDISQLNTIPSMLAELKEQNYKVRVRVSCVSEEVKNINRKLLLEAGATKVEVAATEAEITKIKSQSLDKKYDKTGIKNEYQDFCLDKGIRNVETGLYYLDKIS